METFNVRIEKTAELDKWLRKLKDLRAKAKILFRIQRIENVEVLEIVKQLAKEFVN